MPDSALSGLPQATLPLARTDLVLVTQGVTPASKRATVGDVRLSRHPGFRAGGTYICGGGRIAIGTGGLIGAADTLYLGSPFPADSVAAAWGGLAARLITAGGSGAAIKMALWRFNVAAGEPRGLAVAGSNTPVDATGAARQLDSLWAASFTPDEADWFVPGIVSTAASPQPTLLQAANTSTFASWAMGDTLQNSGGSTSQGWSIAQPFASDIMALNIVGGLAKVATVGGPPLFAIRT